MGTNHEPDARDRQGIDNLFHVPGSQYSDPEFSWFDTVAPTAIVFLDSDRLGEQYRNDAFVGDFNNGTLYHFRPNVTRDGFDFDNPDRADLIADTETELGELILGTGFGGITDLKVVPEGPLYILSFMEGKIFRVLPKPVVNVTLSSTTTSVPQGGEILFTIELESTTGEPQGFAFALILRLPMGQEFSLSLPFPIGMPPFTTVIAEPTLQPIPSDAPLGTWTLKGVVLRPNEGIIDHTSIDFTVF